MSAIKSHKPDLAKIGIEFWTAIAEKETKLKTELDDVRASVTVHEGSNCCHYTQGALEELLPGLLECLTKRVRGSRLRSALLCVRLCAAFALPFK